MALLRIPNTDCMEESVRTETLTAPWRPLPPMADVFVEIPESYAPVRKVPGKVIREAKAKRRAQQKRAASRPYKVVSEVPRTEEPTYARKHKRTSHNLRSVDEWLGGEFDPKPHAKMFQWWWMKHGY